MEDSYDPRSRSMQIQPYTGPPRPENLRHPPYTTSYSYSFSHSNGAITPYPNPNLSKDSDFKKPKNVSKSWSFADPEFQRKRRVASYKMYGVEGKVKGTFGKSFRWLKDKYTRVVYGWW